MASQRGLCSIHNVFKDFMGYQCRLMSKVQKGSLQENEREWSTHQVLADPPHASTCPSWAKATSPLQPHPKQSLNMSSTLSPAASPNTGWLPERDPSVNHQYSTSLAVGRIRASVVKESGECVTVSTAILTLLRPIHLLKIHVSNPNNLSALAEISYWIYSRTEVTNTVTHQGHVTGI